MIRWAAALLFALGACAPAPQDPAASRAVPLASSLPPIKTFAAGPVETPSRANAEIAQDFLDLSFRMESGRILPVMTRFEGPIQVKITGNAPATLRADLDQLLSRLRREANINIAQVTSGPAQIIVATVPRATLNAAVPRAACFVVPRVDSWQDYLRKRNTKAVDWTTLTERTQATMFVPSDVAPQEARDCLHEELAQALGPLNDLYRLPDSVFNDDNIHSVLTSFDMMVLKTYYAPELANGMSRTEVASRLPAVLSRLNPAGRRAGIPPGPVADRAWIDAIQIALSGNATPDQRRAAARQAISVSEASGWGGTREAFALYAYGRLLVGHDSDQAMSVFARAENIYNASPATKIHAAHIAVQRAAFALAAGDSTATIAIANNAIPEARSHQNAALLATLMMFKAQALDLQGETEAAKAVRLDSLGWARYGFGQDTFVQARLDEIAALRPL